MCVCTCLSTWVSGAAGRRCDEPQTVIGLDRQSEELPPGLERGPTSSVETKRDKTPGPVSVYMRRQSGERETRYTEKTRGTEPERVVSQRDEAGSTLGRIPVKNPRSSDQWGPEL